MKDAAVEGHAGSLTNPRWDWVGIITISTVEISGDAVVITADSDLPVP